MNVVFINIVFVIFSVCEIIQNAEATHQVNGYATVTCNGQPASDVNVMLIDEDQPNNDDDICLERTTDKNGVFQGSGSCYDHGSKIDPYLLLVHKCTTHGKWTTCAYKTAPDRMSYSSKPPIAGTKMKPKTGLNVYYRQVEITKGCVPWKPAPLELPA